MREKHLRSQLLTYDADAQLLCDNSKIVSLIAQFGEGMQIVFGLSATAAALFFTALPIRLRIIGLGKNYTGFEYIVLYVYLFVNNLDKRPNRILEKSQKCSILSTSFSFKTTYQEEKNVKKFKILYKIG